MTTTTADTSATEAAAGSRRVGHPILRVTRLHTVAWPYAAWWPWAILALSFSVNLAIFGSVSEADEAWTGGLASIYGTQVFVYVQYFNRSFPFAFGLSVTRRAYYHGTWLFMVLEALAFAAVLLALRLVEGATDGWGVSLEYFGVSFVRESGVMLQYAVYVVPFLLMAALGTGIGVLVVRWGSNGLLGLVAALIVASGAVAFVAGRAHWWDEIGDWFAAQSPAALFAGWPLPFVAVLALLGYATIRRATP